MKLCDRCFHKGDYVKSVDSIKFQNTHEIFDLCESCSQILRDYCTDATRGIGKASEEAEN